MKKRYQMSFNYLKNKEIIWIISFLILGGFLFLLINLARINPLCCADDAYIATVSKNLANGHGYLSTNNSWVTKNFDEKGMLFDPGISTGAPSILATAFGIYLFGPYPSVPGYMHIVLYGILLSFLLLSLAKVTNQKTAAFIIVVFICFIFTTSHAHLEQWHAQLGEVLSILLVVTGSGILSWFHQTKVCYFLAGLLMGAAVLTKLVVLIYVATIFFVVLFHLLKKRLLFSAQGLLFILSFTVGISTLIVCFELWKLIVLHSDGWLANWKEMKDFIVLSGVSSSPFNFWQIVHERSIIANSNFFLSGSAFTLLLIGYPRLFFSLPNSLKYFSELLLWGMLLHLIYWFFFSIGWQRYLYISIVTGSLLVSIALVAGKGYISRSLIIFATFIIFFHSFFSISWTNLLSRKKLPSIVSAQKISHYIDMHHSKEKIMTEWWAHTATLEYLSSQLNRYSSWLEPSNQKTIPNLVITNSPYLLKEDIAFISLLHNSCQAEIKEGNYTLYSCKK